MMFYNTVNDILKDSLTIIMASEEFKDFRLVGGTALSLQLGHRMSIDIDLFSDADYGSIDFERLDNFLNSSFTFVDHFSDIEPAMGKSYLIGTDKDQAVKLDIYYTDSFIRSAIVANGVRLATIEEIIAMKVDVVQRGGRKKDFWDLHECIPKYDIGTMLALHAERYPYSHDRDLILKNFIDFTIADDDFDPICLQGKYWEFIKENIENAIDYYQKL